MYRLCTILSRKWQPFNILLCYDNKISKAEKFINNLGKVLDIKLYLKKIYTNISSVK